MGSLPHEFKKEIKVIKIIQLCRGFLHNISEYLKILKEWSLYEF